MQIFVKKRCRKQTDATNPNVFTQKNHSDGVVFCSGTQD